MHIFEAKREVFIERPERGPSPQKPQIKKLHNQDKLKMEKKKNPPVVGGRRRESNYSSRPETVSDEQTAFFCLRIGAMCTTRSQSVPMTDVDR